MSKKIKLTKINKEKIKDIFISTAGVVLLVGSMAVVGVGAFLDVRHDKKIEDEAANIGLGYYTVDSGENVSISDLYYVKKDNNVYLCKRIAIGEENKLDAAGTIVHNNLTGTYIPKYDSEIVYEFQDIKNNNAVICTSEDKNVNIYSVAEILAEQIIEDEITSEDINEEYIDKKNIK